MSASERRKEINVRGAMSSYSMIEHFLSVLQVEAEI
jgi:hypothetical protein